MCFKFSQLQHKVDLVQRYEVVKEANGFSEQCMKFDQNNVLEELRNRIREKCICDGIFRVTREANRIGKTFHLKRSGFEATQTFYLLSSSRLISDNS